MQVAAGIHFGGENAEKHGESILHTKHELDTWAGEDKNHIKSP